MPRIPSFKQNQRLSGASTGQVADPGQARREGESIAKFGRSLASFGSDLAKIQNMENKIKVDQARTAAQTAAISAFETTMTHSENGVTGEDMMSNFDSSFQKNTEFMQELPGEIQTLIKDEVQDVQNQFRLKLMPERIRAFNSGMKTTVDGLEKNMSSELMANPTDWESIQQRYVQQVNGLDDAFKIGDKEKLITQLNKSVAPGVMEGFIQKGRTQGYQAAREFQNHPLMKNADPEFQSQITERIRAAEIGDITHKLSLKKKIKASTDFDNNVRNEKLIDDSLQNMSLAKGPIERAKVLQDFDAQLRMGRGDPADRTILQNWDDVSSPQADRERLTHSFRNRILMGRTGGLRGEINAAVKDKRLSGKEGSSILNDLYAAGKSASLTSSKKIEQKASNERIDSQFDPIKTISGVKIYDEYAQNMRNQLSEEYAKELAANPADFNGASTRAIRKVLGAAGGIRTVPMPATMQDFGMVSDMQSFKEARTKLSAMAKAAQNPTPAQKKYMGKIALYLNNVKPFIDAAEELNRLSLQKKSEERGR